MPVPDSTPPNPPWPPEQPSPDDPEPEVAKPVCRPGGTKPDTTGTEKS